MIKKLFIKYKELLSYIFFGVLTTVVSLGSFKIFDALLGAKLYLVTNIISWILAVIFAYITNKLWVFESKSRKLDVVAKELVGFLGARLFSLVAEEAGLWIMLSVIRINGFAIFGYDISANMLAKLVMQVIIVILNYIFSKFIIFRKKNK